MLNPPLDSSTAATARPAPPSPSSARFASSPRPLFKSFSFDPTAYQSPPPILHGSLLRPIRTPLRPLNGASTARPTSSASSSEPTHLVNGAANPAAASHNGLTFQLGKLKIGASPEPPLVLEDGDEMSVDEEGEEGRGGGTARTAAAAIGKMSEVELEGQMGGAPAGGRREMEVDEDERAEPVDTRFRPFTFEWPSLHASVGFDLIVPVGLRTGPLTADELPPLPNGTKGATSLVLMLLARNQAQHCYNILPAATLANASRYECVSASIPIPFISTTPAVQPPQPTRLNLDLAQGSLSFLAYFTYAISAYTEDIDEAEKWIQYLEQDVVVARAKEKAFGVYFAEYLRGIGRYRAQGGWDGRLKRLVEYVGRSDGWDHHDPMKERALRPLAHFIGPTAHPKTFVQYMLQELRRFRDERPVGTVDVYLSFGGTAGNIDRDTPYERVQEVEALLIVGRKAAVTLGGLNIAPGGDLPVNSLVAGVLRSASKDQSLVLLDDGSSPVAGCAPSSVLIAAQAVERKRDKGIANPYAAALESAEQRCKGDKVEQERREKQPGITGPRFLVAEAPAPATGGKRRGVHLEREDREGEDELSEDDVSEGEQQKGGLGGQQGSGGGAPGKALPARRLEPGLEKQLDDLSAVHQKLVKPFVKDPYFKLLCGIFFARKTAFKPTIITPESIRRGVDVVCSNTVIRRSQVDASYKCRYSLVLFDGADIADFTFKTFLPKRHDVISISWDGSLKLFIFRDDQGEPVLRRPVGAPSANAYDEMTWTIDDFLRSAINLNVAPRAGESQAAAKQRVGEREAERKRVARAFFA
ncbi:hypothetical protein JCM8208_004306 [Rhodotorula glutinis]